MPFKDCICFQLGKTLRQVTREYREEISQYKLTHGQFFMLVAVMEEEGLLPSELAEKTSLDRPSTTGLLDRLEKDGWIERRTDEKDRRSLRVHLTPYGRGLKAPVLKIFESTNRGFIDLFSEKEWIQMQNFLGRLERPSSEEAVGGPGASK